MQRLPILLLLVLAGCGVTKQPKSAKTVAAYEIPLPTTADKNRFLELLSRNARADGFHVDAATPEELKAQSDVSPITLNATVWRGANDEEPIASAMDFKDHIGRVWLSFSLGEDPGRSSDFRSKLMLQIEKIWPGTMSLPIMPNGAIPLTNDLRRTPSGYVVKPSAAEKYRVKSG